MRQAASVLLIAFLGLVAPPQAAAEHPITGVITLLEKLEVQAKQEGEAEAASFQKFQYWCKRSTRMLTRAMKKENKMIDELADKIDGLSKDISTLGEDIEALEGELEVLDQQAERAKAMRAQEHELFKKDWDNLDGSIIATDEALEVMETSEEGVTLAQKGHKAKKAAIQGPEDLLKLKPGGDNPFKPKAKVFSAHEGGVIETFKGLEDGWSIDKLSEEEQEVNALTAYKLAKQARDTAIATAKASKTEKEGVKGDKSSEKAQAESDKAEEEKKLSGDTASLEGADKDCKTMTAEFEERSGIRNGELEAMDMAKKILAKVTGVRPPDHKIPSKALLEATARVEQDTANYESSSISFLQVDDPKVKAVNLLKQAATEAHSKSLQKLAQEISTFDGPFDKIKAMIQKMVFRLMSEQKDEDEHKLWCDGELSTSTESKEDKEEKVNLLNSKISEMDEAIKLKMKEIMQNSEKVDQIAQSVATETSLRDENHAEILATVKDSQDAQGALTSAITVLKEFYKESGMIPKEPWEFVQTASRRDVELPEKPSTWGDSYTGTADPKNAGEGILAILDETMQKFSKMEADAKVTDETDQKDYENDMNAKKIETDETNMDTQMKTQKKDSLQQKMETAAASLKGTSAELDAVEQYLKDLEPACVGGDSTYEDRKKARTDEIGALGKAQTILEDAFRQKAFLQKRK